MACDMEKIEEPGKGISEDFVLGDNKVGVRQLENPLTKCIFDSLNFLLVGGTFDRVTCHHLVQPQTKNWAVKIQGWEMLTSGFLRERQGILSVFMMLIISYAKVKLPMDCQ